MVKLTQKLANTTEKREQVTEFEHFNVEPVSAFDSPLSKKESQEFISKDAYIGGSLQSDGALSDTGFRSEGIYLVGVNRVSILTTDVTWATTAAENNLISVSIPGKLLATNRGVRVKLDISAINTAGGGTLTIRFKYGATTLVTSANVAMGASSAGWIEAVLLSAGTDITQEGSMNIFFSTKGQNSTALTQAWANAQGTSAEDSSIAQTLAISAQFSTSAGTNTITMVNAIVEKIM